MSNDMEVCVRPHAVLRLTSLGLVPHAGGGRDRCRMPHRWGKMRRRGVVLCDFPAIIGLFDLHLLRHHAMQSPGGVEWEGVALHNEGRLLRALSLTHRNLANYNRQSKGMATVDVTWWGMSPPCTAVCGQSGRTYAAGVGLIYAMRGLCSLSVSTVWAMREPR